MQRKGFEFIAFFLSGPSPGSPKLPIREVRSEDDISTSGWMLIKVLWLNCLLLPSWHWKGPIKSVMKKGLCVLTNLQENLTYHRKTIAIDI